jgi:hypothetical protein
MLPYINENLIIKSYYFDENDYVFLAYFPFYKYAKNSSKLGVRDALASLFRKNKFESTKGYEPLEGTGNTWQRVLPKSVSTNTIFNKETKAFLDAHASKYMFFTAPFRSDTKNMNFVSQLKQNYSDFWDFSTAVKDPKMFKNGYHLNHHGATDFSIVLSNKIKTN